MKEYISLPIYANCEMCKVSMHPFVIYANCKMYKVSKNKILNNIFI